MAKKPCKPATHYWVGIVDGGPHLETIHDIYGTCVHVELFTSRAEARRRYEKIERVTLVRAARAAKEETNA